MQLLIALQSEIYREAHAMQFITMRLTRPLREILVISMRGVLVEERVADPTLDGDDIRSRIEGNCRRTPLG